MLSLGLRNYTETLECHAPFTTWSVKIVLATYQLITNYKVDLREDNSNRPA